jgi:hypothetical protein
MLLSTPETIQHILWQGPLELDNEQIAEERFRFMSPPSRPSYVPTVSIGQPEVWPLAELYSGAIPSWLEVKQNEAQFFLVRFACSLRNSGEDKFQITQAKFSVDLLPDNQQNRAIAFDLYPLEINQEIKRNCKVSLSPNIKFKEAQASLGGTDFALEYPELQPTIIATGVGEYKADWEYRKAQGKGVQGSKFMHMIVKVPNNMQLVRTKLNLTARLEQNGNPLVKWLFKTDIKKVPSDCLIVNLVS